MGLGRTSRWLLTAFLFFLLLFTLFIWGLNRILVGSAPEVRSGTVLTIRLQGAIGESPQQSLFGTAVTVHEIDEALRRAAADTRVDAVLLEIGRLTGGYGKVQEVRAAVEHFRESDKPVVAFLELASNLDLYVASAANIIYQIPSGDLILGMYVQQPFYRDFFDKIGVRFEVFASGPYKSAFASYTDTAPSDAQYEMEDSLLENLYRQWLGDVAADRGMTVESVATAFDEGYLSARRAQAVGFIDELGYRDMLEAKLAEFAGESPLHVSVRDYLRDTEPTELFAPESTIALIYISGMMVPGDFDTGLFGAEVAAGGTIERYIREASEDPSVKAIVLRVDSGGGAVTAADVMGRAIELAAQQKPVVVSMSDVAASGGYWIASKATRVFANRATYTGSIGVVMARPDLEGTYELLGINQEIIKRGKNADLMSTTGPLRPDQIDILTRNVTDIYEEFLDVVSEGRNMDRNAVDSVAQGRVWTGEQALDHNLVDDIGGLREALVAARADAGIEPGQRTALRIFPPTRTIFDELASLFNISAVTLRSSPMPSGPLSLSLGAVWERIRILQIAGPLWAIMDTALPVPAR